jgi:DNA-binding PadR family transcriptional regulator
MPIQHAILALLVDGESYGYELRGAFESSIGPQWGGLNIGHLYQVLDRLVRDGLVTKREVAQRARPDKIVYRLTAEGREELDRWLAAPAARRGGYRDDLFLKLFAASRLGEEALTSVLAKQREADVGELAALAALRLEHQVDPLVDLLIEAAVLDVQGRLRLVEVAESRRESIVQAASSSRRLDSLKTPSEQILRRSGS